MLKNRKGGISSVRFLTNADMLKIHEQSLCLLQDRGIEIKHEAALKNLADCGADVNFQTKNVTIRAGLVEQALKTVPREITMAARNQEQDIVLEPGGKMYTRNSGGMTQVVDLESGEIRDAVLSDTEDFTRLADALAHINVVAPLYPSDVPLGIVELKTLEAMFKHTDKHISVRALNPGTFSFIVEMAGAVVGGSGNLRERPIISILDSPISPLSFPDVFIEALYTGGEYGIPVEACATPNIGATGPITLAGSLLLANVEQLATIVISQLAHPGAPLIWAPRFPAMDMVTGITGMLTEGALISAAAVQMAVEHYHLICDFHGPATNAIVAGAESVFQECIAAFVTSYAGRPAILCGAGALELGITASFEDLVIADDLFAVLERTIDGIIVNEDTLAADVIADVGIGGHYLGHEHTLKHLRGNRLNSSLLKPKTREQWVDQGSPSLVKRAGDKAREILKHHQPEKLEEGTERELSNIIHAAHQELS
ncbi:MAG: trimethylamine methyltransferase family protein [Deltaproteobacteria bacterium]